MSQSTTFRLKDGRHRISVNLDPEAVQAYQYLEAQGTDVRKAINAALVAAAAQAWEQTHQEPN